MKVIYNYLYFTVKQMLLTKLQIMERVNVLKISKTIPITIKFVRKINKIANKGSQ